MKKPLFLSSFFFLLSSFCVIFGYSSDDLSNAQYLATNSIVKSQKSPELYRLDDAILRQEVIGMALKLKGIALPENYTCKKYFTDTTANDWVCRAVELAADNGIITRANTKARPTDLVTRAEALAILLKTGKVSLGEPRRITQADGSVWSLYSDLQKLGFTQWQTDMLDSLPGCSLVNHGESCEDGASTNIAFSQFKPNASALRSEVFEFAAIMSGFIAGDDTGGILDDLDILLPKTIVSPPTGPLPQTPNVLSVDTIKALLKDEPIETISASPKIVLVVFSDFECPFCTRFFQSTLAPTLTNTSSETAMIYKQFPLPFHSHAYSWAVESECVEKNLGSVAFFDYVRKRYADQESSISDISPDLTTAQMDACLTDETIAQRITDEQTLAALYKVNGTPTTLVINIKTGYYETVVGAQSKEVFDEAIQVVKDHK